MKIHIQYHRPPDRTELFVQTLIHDDGRVKVTFARGLQLDAPLVLDGQVALEDGSDAVWFTFPGAWHDIGRFYTAEGRFTGIYANILTPCVFEPGGTWLTTDLFLDLWLPAAELGGPLRPRILDADELDRAEASGWVESPLAERARKEVRSLEREARAGRWPPAPVEEWTRDRARVAVLDVLENRS